MTLGSISVTTGDIVMGVGGVATAVGLTGDISIPTSGVTTVNSVQTGAGSSIATAINNSSSNAINGDNIKIDATLQVGAGGANKLGVDLTHPNTWTGTQTLSAAGTGLNVTTNATVGGTLGVTGQTSLGSTVLTESTMASFSTDQADIAPGTANSFYMISSTNPAGNNVGGISGGLTVGRIIVLMNSGANPIVLLNQSTGAGGTQFSIPGGNAIMGVGGSATFIYDGTFWHMTASS